MNRLRIGITVVVLSLTLAMVAPAQAGRSCEARQPDAVTVERSMDLALQAARELEASGAQVVVLARAGQDLGRYGLRWSHLGFAYRDASQTPAPWRVVHELNACGSERGDLYRQGLGEFFMDDLHRFEAGYVIPTPEVQSRLLTLLSDNRRVAALHTAAYSMVAYPWSQTYQQSNQWAIETLALAMEPGAILSRERAQAWLRFKGYEPTTLRLGPLTRLGGRVGSANIAFDDHPSDKRYSDRIETVTVDSVLAWMQRTQLAAAPFTVLYQKQ